MSTVIIRYVAEDWAWVIFMQAIDLVVAYKEGSETEQIFVQHLALFLVSFLKEHGSLLETPELQESLGVGLQYLLLVARVDNNEIFKITCDYWGALAANLFHESSSGAAGYPQLMLGAQPTPRRLFYAPYLEDLRQVMVERMAKPEEVLVVEVDGEVIREKITDTDGIEQYKQMRETLVYLTHLDYENTEMIMREKLTRQVDGTEYGWGPLNTLCWAIGSISGAMDVDKEKKFLVIVIKDLLGLCEERVGKPHKAIIASNIMYIVGQYPRFLRAHWKFLKTVVNKLFEFMHEKHEGVQDMACETFIKIANKCKKHFVILQVHEQQPFIDEILAGMQGTICELEQHQIHTFYEAIGHMIFAQTEKPTRSHLIKRLMDVPNQQWRYVILQAQQDVSVLEQPPAIDMLINILKTNVKACSSIGNDFILQIQEIYLDMLLMYKTMSENVARHISATGEMATTQPIIKDMRIVKREILKLIGTWVAMSENPAEVMANFVPPLLEAVLGDYQGSIEQARDAEVLATMAKVVNTLKEHIIPEVLNIFAHVFDSTLPMITRDPTHYPEHRTAFYTLLEAITKHCFMAFGDMSKDQFEMVVQAIIWGFQHPIRNIAETSLRILLELLSKVAESGDFAQTFYGTFFLTIMEAVLVVVTDSLHYSELKEHSQILCRMFWLIESGGVQVHLNPENPNQPNTEFIAQWIQMKLKAEFPELLPEQLEFNARAFFAYNRDPAKFQSHLRDFLVESKEATGADMSGQFILY